MLILGGKNSLFTISNMSSEVMNFYRYYLTDSYIVFVRVNVYFYSITEKIEEFACKCIPYLIPVLVQGQLDTAWYGQLVCLTVEHRINVMW